MTVLVVDNYDSFTYNLVQYLGQNGADVTVRRNDAISIDDIRRMRPDGIMLSPGPCTPGESGICLDVLRAYLEEGGLRNQENRVAPLFGVCLGHQAIAEVSGATVVQARNIMHGKASRVSHDGLGLFSGMPNPFSAIRYHSLIVTAASIPDGFVVTATSDDDHEVMGLRHEKLPIEGVQFHPESILTECGERIVQNYLRVVEAAT